MPATPQKICARQNGKENRVPKGVFECRNSGEHGLRVTMDLQEG